MSVQLSLWNDATKTLANPSVGIPAPPALAPVQTAAPAESAPPKSKVDALSTLRQQIRKVETARRPKQQVISSGAPPLDEVLPQNGYPPGCLVEWIAAGEAGGAAWLSLLAARSAHQSSGGKIVVFDSDRTFYPPAAIACGIPADAFVVLQPQTRADAMWAMDQSLRSSAVAAVWATLPKLDDSEARRLQLAAETGGSLGMLMRPTAAINQPSWAEVRWQVRGAVPLKNQTSSQADRLLSVRLLRARGASSGQHLLLQIDQQSRIVRKELQRESKSAERLAAELAHPKVAGRRQQHAARQSRSA